MEVDPGKHVQIHVRYIETTIIIRQIGRYFTFSIQMPEELVNMTLGIGRSSTSIHTHAHGPSSDSRISGYSGADLQLCMRGCPAAEQIRYKEYLANRNRTVFRYANKPVKLLPSSSYSLSSSSSSSLSVSSSDSALGNGHTNDNSNNNDRATATGTVNIDLDSITQTQNQTPETELKTVMLTWAYAEQLCREGGLVDFYFDSCVFDLMATGDLNFTLSAIGALKDMVKLNPSAIKSWVNRAWLSDDAKHGSKNGRSSSSSAGNSGPSIHRNGIASSLTYIIVHILSWLHLLAQYAAQWIALIYKESVISSLSLSLSISKLSSATSFYHVSSSSSSLSLLSSSWSTSLSCFLFSPSSLLSVLRLEVMSLLCLTCIAKALLCDR